MTIQIFHIALWSLWLTILYGLSYSYLFVLEQTESAPAAGTTAWSSIDKTSLFKEKITS